MNGRPDPHAAAIAQIGTRLRARREQLGLTRDEARARSGIGLQTLIRIEAGNPGASLACVQRAAAALGLVLSIMPCPERR